jgi:indolepyruvate ferredoxin oxidoreductase
VAHAERGAGGEGALAAAVARGLHKLMAYKDEYEVARLHLAAEFREQLEATFEGPVKLVYHLHPPLLRRFGRERKLALGPWFRGPLRVLRALRRVRGTPLDPFGRLSSRREERELITWYEDLLDRAVAVLDPATLAVAAELAALPDDIRGYEEIKSRNATKARLRARALLKRLDRSERVTILDPARGADGVQ